MPCSSSTACLFPDDVLHEANICFRSLPLAECEGLLGMPTSTNVSEPETDAGFQLSGGGFNAERQLTPGHPEVTDRGQRSPTAVTHRGHWGLMLVCPNLEQGRTV